jgi:hypothetical protein
VKNLMWWRALPELDLGAANRVARSAAAHVATQAHVAGGYAGAEDHARVLSGTEARGTTI